MNCSQSLASLMLVTALATGCSSDTDSRMLALEGGSPDSTAGAVVLFIPLNDSQWTYCSGVAIAPNLVATVSHCIDEPNAEEFICGETTLGPIVPTSQLSVTSSDSVARGRPANAIGVAAVFTPEVSDPCNNDIALLVLEDDVVDAADVIEPRFDIPTAAGELFDTIGYGPDANNSGAGVRTRVTGAEVWCVGEGCGAAADVFDREFLGNGGACGSDQGGPALDVDGRVFGLMGRYSVGCTQSTYTSLMPWRELIEEAAIAAGHTFEPETVDVLEPSETDMDLDESDADMGGTERTDSGPMVVIGDSDEAEDGGCATVQSNRPTRPGLLVLLALALATVRRRRA